MAQRDQDKNLPLQKIYKRGLSPVVLVVEDEESLNNLMQKVIHREGFITEGVTSGSDAIIRVMDDPDVIIILDYELPDMSGMEVIGTLTDKGIQVPFIVTTGRGDEKIAVEMMKLGAKDYIVKSATLSDILPSVVKRVMKDIEQEHKLAQAEMATIERQAELSALYKVSSELSQTLDIDKFFPIIFQAITGLDLFGIDKKGGIFTVDEDRMTLVSHHGHPDSFIEIHKGLRVGDCLCGHAASTGEIIISKHSHKDGRHTISYPGMNPHGHIVIPLKARDMVVGVLYLYMPVDFEINERKLRLLNSIGNQIGISVDNAKLYADTKKSSLHDPLTGLANRRLMHIFFSRGFAKAKRNKSPFSIILLDIDFFKKYNDTKGHTAGDNALIEIGEHLLKETREVDLVVRYGGEEFLVLLPDTTLERAQEAAERIRMIIETNTGVTVSLGVSSYKKEIFSEEELINRADEALYRAKKNGKNRVELSS